MKQKQKEDKMDIKKSQSDVSGQPGKTEAAAGQAAEGTDRAEVDSDEAHRAHHAGAGGESSSDTDVTRSEEAKNQEATSKQSRALSGTTAPRKV